MTTNPAFPNTNVRIPCESRVRAARAYNFELSDEFFEFMFDVSDNANFYSDCFPKSLTAPYCQGRELRMACMMGGPL